MRRMQFGQIVDYCIEYDNQQTDAEKRSNRRKATQADIDNFFG